MGEEPNLIGVQAIAYGVVGLVSQWQVDAEHFWTRGVTLIFYWQVSHCQGAVNGWCGRGQRQRQRQRGEGLMSQQAEGH
jgi:hypothetical protein